MAMTPGPAFGIYDALIDKALQDLLSAYPNAISRSLLFLRYIYLEGRACYLNNPFSPLKLRFMSQVTFKLTFKVVSGAAARATSGAASVAGF